MNNTSNEKPHAPWWMEVISILISLVIATAIIIPIRLYVVEPFLVRGPSMSPVFETGHYLIVEKFTTKSHNPERGDIVVFKIDDTSKAKKNGDPRRTNLIKRTIGLPGETIALRGGFIFINGERLDDQYHPQPTYQPSGEIFLKEGQEYTIPDDSYIFMGDNRLHSRDSRSFGIVHRDDIVGRPIIQLWPLNRIRLISTL